ncbi:MAG: sarcosine oxidase subunit gamma family protein [Acidimicrobiia bacterium]
MVDIRPTVVSQIGAFRKGSARLRLNDASELSKVIVKGAPGTNLSTQLSAISPGQSASRRTVRIGSARPNEWLYLGPIDAVAAAVADLDLSGHTAVTDVTHARSAVRISGTASIDLLQRCCSVDFSDAMFPDEAMATAAVAAVRCDIIRDDVANDRSYIIVFDRSYADYMTAVLGDIFTEVGLASAPKS